MIGIYAIINFITGDAYVGSSKDIHVRWKKHLTQLHSNKHHNVYLQRAWNKYGSPAFIWKILKEVKIDALLENEQYFLDNENNLYNIGKTASGGDNISNHPHKDEIISKIKKSLNKKIQSMSNAERKLRFGQKGNKNGMWNKTHTNKAKERISISNKGKLPINKGKTNEQLLGKEKATKISKMLSEHGKKKTGTKNPFYGKTHSRKTKNKIRHKKIKQFEESTPEERYNKNPQSRKVEIDGITYYGVSEAARQLNVCPATICYRINSKNKKFKQYKYVREVSV
jgi:group I intron endonuclease